MIWRRTLRYYKKIRVVINIHYYEGALLEMPQLYTSVSHWVSQLLSEEHPIRMSILNFEGAVKFFDEESIDSMMVRVRNAQQC